MAASSSQTLTGVKLGAGETMERAASVNLSHLRVACSNCNLRELCLPVGLSPEELDRVDRIVATRRKVRRGEAPFRAGDRFDALYALRLGFLKSTLVSADGHEQVTGFHMAGEIVGLDGISADSHTCDTIALEDSEVCVIPYDSLEEFSSTLPALQNHLRKVMSREIVREHSVMLLLGSMRAEERLAAFLLNLSQRFEARGYSRSQFVLRMTRAEIGSYLGLKLETVSRALSHFAQEGLIDVEQKHVHIRDADGLRALLGTGAPRPAH